MYFVLAAGPSAAPPGPCALVSASSCAAASSAARPPHLPALALAQPLPTPAGPAAWSRTPCRRQATRRPPPAASPAPTSGCPPRPRSPRLRPALRRWRCPPLVRRWGVPPRARAAVAAPRGRGPSGASARSAPRCCSAPARPLGAAQTWRPAPACARQRQPLSDPSSSSSGQADGACRWGRISGCLSSGCLRGPFQFLLTQALARSWLSPVTSIDDAGCRAMRCRLDPLRLPPTQRSCRCRPLCQRRGLRVRHPHAAPARLALRSWPVHVPSSGAPAGLPGPPGDPQTAEKFFIRQSAPISQSAIISLLVQPAGDCRLCL